MRGVDLARQKSPILSVGKNKYFLKIYDMQQKI